MNERLGALCRRFDCEERGQDLPPLGWQWVGDLIELATEPPSLEEWLEDV